ncbi:iron-sulfur cluster repair di-iron protein [Caldalkalibacillus thermarum]|uniref:iron-sulfur cluster repair di-iron protein n=1 Tax=Caldalkalibacillus thermarum TaxID=296745 RepID=UPI00166F3EA6|nr:iron-sulfur cluster repair di-iron protein [Caldalkalibacillus thermarum]GGK37009.1 iron-sulfur cluster repair di-iron protein [Caldalkalibacillus thermarum]
MEKVFDRTSKVGDIVTIYPQASDIFKAHRIDFCCGGDRPLGEVLEEKNLNEEEILNRLNEGYAQKQTHDQQQTNWMEASYRDIIRHIIDTHHAYLYRELPQLSQYVTKVFRVHGPDRPELADVHRLFHTLKTELEQHALKEEEHVFPLIQAYEENPTPEARQKLIKGIAELEDEHDTAGDILKQLRDLTSDFQPPEGACMTYQMTYQRLEELESDMFEHVHLENNILFKRILNELKSS